LIADAAWLEKHGYSRALRNKYVARGWLDQVARGVYRRPAPTLQGEARAEGLRWQPVVISLQTPLGCSYTVGGRTALELQGFAHYLSAQRHEIHLYGIRKPPGWTLRLKPDSRLVFHNADKLFASEATHPRRRKDGSENDLVQSSYIRQPWGQWEWPLTMSSPERAILELLDEVPQRETFHQADVLMEGLRNLSRGGFKPDGGVPQYQGEALVPLVCGTAPTRLAEEAGPQPYRPRQRKAYACARRQARSEIQHNCSGVHRCRWMKLIASRFPCL